MKSTGLLTGLLLATTASAEGLSFSVDIPALTVFANHGAGELTGGNAWFDTKGSAVAYRLTAEYDFSETFGVRARAFSFGGEFDDPTDIFKARTFDFEAVLRPDLGGLDLQAFAGLRVGSVDWSDEEGGSGYGFSGVGPTLGLQIGQTFGNGFGLVFGGRYSALLGDTTETLNDDTAENTVVPTIDLRLGIDYKKDMANGGTMTFGAGLESISFLSLSGNVDSDIDPEDVSVTLAGPYIRLGFTF